MVSNFIYPFDFYFQSPWKERGCSQKHFLNVHSFSKHQIWCPSLLGWDGVNCLAKKWGGAKARSAISYILLISTFSLQPTAFWNWCSKHAFIFKILFHFQNVLSFSKFLKGYSCFKAFKQTFEVNFVSFMKFNIDNNRTNFSHSTCVIIVLRLSSKHLK